MEFNFNLYFSSIQVLINYEDAKKYKKGELPPLNFGDCYHASKGSIEYKKDIFWKVANKEYLNNFSRDKFYYLDKSFITGVEEVMMDEDEVINTSSFVDYTLTLKCRNRLIYDIFSTPIMLS